MKQSIAINGRECLLYECGEQPQVLLIQPLGEHERSTIDNEIALIQEAVHVPFVMVALAINDWEKELTPWHDPKLSTRKEVGEHVFETLDYITEHLMPYMFERFGKLPVAIGGYSLAGLFALWAGTQTNTFAAIAACSPSLWIEGWANYGDAHPLLAKVVYLSLGDKEEKTRNPLSSMVGDRVREQHDRHQFTTERCTLVWEQGGHFVTPHLRTARGFAWCIKQLK